MTEQTKIQWADHTFNSWRGCTKVAAGCTNCYAEATSKRNPRTLGIWGDNGTRVVAAESQWKQVEKWNRDAGVAYDRWFAHDCRGDKHNPKPHRPRVFVASLADVFEDWKGAMVNSHGDTLMLCPNGHIDGSVWKETPSEIECSSECGEMMLPLTMADVRARLFRLIDDCPNLDFLLVTKRPENIPAMWPVNYGFDVDQSTGAAKAPHRENCWLITSIANQEDADRNIPMIASFDNELCPIIGLSVEPLAGPIKLRSSHLSYLSWVIVGGESGPNARPCNVEWIRDIIRQCKAAGVPCFVKQLGAKPYYCDERHDGGMANYGKLVSCRGDVCQQPVITDPKGGDPSEWPEDLRVRQFPKNPQKPMAKFSNER